MADTLMQLQLPIQPQDNVSNSSSDFKARFLEWLERHDDLKRQQYELDFLRRYQ